MSKDVVLMLLGVWVAVLPFLGFPSDWDMWLLVASGVVIVILGIILRRGKRKRAHTHTKEDHIAHAEAEHAQYEHV